MQPPEKLLSATFGLVITPAVRYANMADWCSKVRFFGRARADLD